MLGLPTIGNIILSLACVGVFKLSRVMHSNAKIPYIYSYHFGPLKQLSPHGILRRSIPGSLELFYFGEHSPSCSLPKWYSVSGMIRILWRDAWITALYENKH